MEDQLRQAEKMQAIGQLAGGVAHDFNNQLAGIVNFAELALNEVSADSKAALFISNIISGSLRSADLTKKMLAFARKGKYVVSPMDINKCISEVVSILIHSIEKKIKMTLQLNANPSTVSGDLSQLQNAILNIALNSRDAMNDGGDLVISTELISLKKKYIKEKRHEIQPG